MALTGIQLALLLGPTVPRPAPEAIAAAVERVEVTHADQGASGFQLTLKAGRGTPYNPLDFPLLRGSLLKPLSRVVLVVRVGLLPEVLFDGVITDQQLTPGDRPGEGILAVTGEDLTALMDLEEKQVAHLAQSEQVIATKIIGAYARHGIVPAVIPPKLIDQPLPTDRVPMQSGTDLAYLRLMAARFDYDVYLIPGPMPGGSVLHWGPPPRGAPQRALSVNMGPASNVRSINFRHDALAPQSVAGKVVDRESGRAMSITATLPAEPPLARAATPRKRTALLTDSGGLTATTARARAQARADSSADRTVVAEGELDTARYGKILRARGTVGLRGVGDTYDGVYSVQRVTHLIEPGRYTQRFTLNREGVGSLSPTLPT